MTNESPDITLERERFRNRLAAEPESAELWEEFGRFLHNTAIDAATEALAWEKVASFFPERHLGLRLGDALARSGRMREGLVHMYDFLRDNRTPFAYRVIARHLLAAGKRRRARKLLRKAFASQPSNAETIFLLGETLRNSSRTQKLELLRKSVELDPRLDEAWLALGTLQILDSDTRTEGVQSLEKACALNPNDYFVHMQLGFGFGMLDQVENALRHFKMAAQLNPDDETALRFCHQYGLLLQTTSRPEKPR